MSNEIDYGIVITVDGKELHHSVLSDFTYASISEDIAEHFEKEADDDREAEPDIDLSSMPSLAELTEADAVARETESEE